MDFPERFSWIPVAESSGSNRNSYRVIWNVSSRFFIRAGSWDPAGTSLRWRMNSKNVLQLNKPLKLFSINIAAHFLACFFVFFFVGVMSTIHLQRALELNFCTFLEIAFSTSLQLRKNWSESPTRNIKFFIYGYYIFSITNELRFIYSKK